MPPAYYLVAQKIKITEEANIITTKKTKAYLESKQKHIMLKKENKRLNKLFSMLAWQSNLDTLRINEIYVKLLNLLRTIEDVSKIFTA